MQIRAHEDATGKKFPEHVHIPGASVPVTDFKIVALTGDRFLIALCGFPGAANVHDAGRAEARVRASETTPAQMAWPGER